MMSYGITRPRCAKFHIQVWNLTKHYSDVIMSAMASRSFAQSSFRRGSSNIWWQLDSLTDPFWKEAIWRWQTPRLPRPEKTSDHNQNRKKCSDTKTQDSWVTCFVLHSYQFSWLWLTWWRHQMETFSALLVICVGNSPVPGEFPTQRPVTRSFDVFFDLRLNKRLSKQSWGWWFETQSRPLWRHRNEEIRKSMVGEVDLWKNC